MFQSQMKDVEEIIFVRGHHRGRRCQEVRTPSKAKRHRELSARRSWKGQIAGELLGEQPDQLDDAEAADLVWDGDD